MGVVLISFKDVDIALFSAGGSISKKFGPLAAEMGCYVRPPPSPLAPKPMQRLRAYRMTSTRKNKTTDEAIRELCLTAWTSAYPYSVSNRSRYVVHRVNAECVLFVPVHVCPNATFQFGIL